VETDAPVGKTKTILLADDDDAVRNITQIMLKGAGYKVISASDGQEAVQLYKKCLSDIDMVMLDVVMPKVSGTEAFKQIREIQADVRVLFASGYDSGTLQTDFVDDKDVQFIQKPYSREPLLSKIRDVLQS
jgi:DNA-binding NtrC family response regulator